MKRITSMKGISRTSARVLLTGPVLPIYLVHQFIVFGSIYLSKVLYAKTGTPKNFFQILKYLTNWDGEWYLKIAANGYDTQSAAFFPLFPLTIRFLHNFGLNQTIAAILVANLALLGVVIVFYRLLKLDYPEEISVNATWYLMLFPTSLYFTASYTEPLFLMMVLIAFYNARRERWLLSGLAGMLAALTRNWGVFLIIPLLYEYLNRIHFNLRLVNAAIIWLSLIPIGLAGYMIYLHFHLGDSLAFVTAQSHWKRSFTYPWQAFGIAFQNIRHDFYFGANLLDLIFASAGVGLMLLGVRRIRVSYQIYAAIGLLIPLLAAAPWAGLLSMPRFVIVLFPLLITLAVVTRNQETKIGIVAVFAGFLTFFSVLFAQSRWVA
ncbi:MAG TPA: mannosyltransferase family protein [Bacillota bacterium]|nr:mannosyltransferase family protein [Bacillota bacterium]